MVGCHDFIFIVVIMTQFYENGEVFLDKLDQNYFVLLVQSPRAGASPAGGIVAGRDRVREAIPRRPGPAAAVTPANR
jgi:hypothetical protein